MEEEIRRIQKAKGAADAALRASSFGIFIYFLFSPSVKRVTPWLILLLLLAGAGGLWRWRDTREHSQDKVILLAAQRYGVDPALVKAVVWRESGFNPSAVGRAGEAGLMQVTEVAGIEWADSVGLSGFQTN